MKDTPKCPSPNQVHLARTCIGPLHLLKHHPLPVWLISGGESAGGARPLDPQWVRDIISDCCRKGVAPFHKQWGTYQSNPLVVEQGTSIAEAKRADPFGRGGGLADAEIVREFPETRKSLNRHAA